MNKNVEIIDYKDGGKGYFEKLNDKCHGLWKITYSDGRPKWERQMHNGLIHGYSKMWNQDELLIEEEYYWKDNLNGVSKKWFDNGIIKEEAEWQVGHLVNCKNYNDQGELIEEYSSNLLPSYDDIKNANDITPDYKAIIKHRMFDFSINSEAKAALEDFKKKTYLIEEGKSFKACDSFMGDIKIHKSGEIWPQSNGIYLAPIIQLCVRDLPLIPKILSDIEYLTIFLHPDGYDYGDDTTLCIRAYNKDDSLIPIQKHESIVQESRPIIFKSVDDYPSQLDLPIGLCEYLEEEYKEYNRCHPYECSFGSKILGWPSWIQTSETSPQWEFVLQIDEYNKPYWNWGDCPSLYIFRHIKTGIFCASMQMY